MSSSIFEVRENALYVDGVNTVDLAQKYGTPLFVYSKKEITKRIAELKRGFLEKHKNTRVAYASKAFLTLAMCAIVKEQGLSLDVVSGGELYTAIQASFPAHRIEFHGNNKTYEELEMAIEYAVGHIIIDAYDELDMVEAICEDFSTTTKVLFRITPEVHTDTHDSICTGKRDSKFGISTDQHRLMPLIKRAIESPYVELAGLHFHIGSQLFSNEGYIEALQTTLALYSLVRDTYGYTMPEVNVGGGFGIRYTKEDTRKDFSYFLDPIMDYISEYSDNYNLARPTVVIEPGRSIVGEAGITLYTVGSVKEIVGATKYVSVDGGMTDNIRKALYDASYEAILANKASDEDLEKVCVVGKCCESGDKLIDEALLPSAVRGDILAIFATGAYCYSMASNYNKHQIPAVVMVEDNHAQLIVKRQSYRDMIRNELRLCTHASIQTVAHRREAEKIAI